MKHTKQDYPYAAAIERAKQWLGASYLLYKPINKRGPDLLPALLRKQAG
jgi:hypothetical protein